MALTAAETQELAMLEREVGGLAPKKKSKLTLAEQRELAQLESELGPVAQSMRISPNAFDASNSGMQTAPQKADFKTKAEAALQGFGQAATFGYLPQLQAAAAKGVDYLAGSTPSDYVGTRDQFIKRDQALSEAAPVAYLAGQVGGGIATPALGVGRAATTLGKIGRGALSGAATGALYNPGDVEGELSGAQLDERATQGLMGGLVGGSAQGILSGGRSALTAWANKGRGLEKASNTMAITAAGAKTGELKKLYDKKAVDRVGQFLKDEKLVGPGKTIEDTYAGAKSILDNAGKQIASIYDSAKGQVLSPTKLAKELDEYFAKELKGKPGGRQILARVQNELENLKDLGDEAGLIQVLEFRRGIDDLINYDKSVTDMPGAQQALVGMRDFLKKKIEGEVSKIKGTDVKKLQELNRRYWSASDVESIGKRAIARENSKMTFGLPELVVGSAVGGTGAVTDVVQGRPEDALGSLAKGALAAGTLKAARTYGPGILATSSSGLGRVLQRDPTRIPARAGAGLIGLVPESVVGSAAERARRKSKLKSRQRIPQGPGLLGGVE